MFAIDYILGESVITLLIRCIEMIYLKEEQTKYRPTNQLTSGKTR